MSLNHLGVQVTISKTETGLLNDPNGFSYFNGKFQLSTKLAIWNGLKWVHTETEDLVHFYRNWCQALARP